MGFASVVIRSGLWTTRIWKNCMPIGGTTEVQVSREGYNAQCRATKAPHVKHTIDTFRDLWSFCELFVRPEVRELVKRWLIRTLGPGHKEIFVAHQRLDSSKEEAYLHVRRWTSSTFLLQDKKWIQC